MKTQFCLSRSRIGRHFTVEKRFSLDEEFRRIWVDPNYGGTMFRPYNQKQSFLLPPSLSDFLDESHPAHVINDIVERLDLSCLENRYGHMGQPPYHPALENMKQDLGTLPDHLVADSGYGNKGTLKTCQEHEVVPVCATGREGKDEKTRALDAMSYDGVEDQFICPHGQAFAFDCERPKDGKRVYRSLNVVGCGCSQYATRDGRGVISALPGHFAKRELRRIMQEPGHREIYRRRKCTVEPVFGQIQVGMGFRRFFYHRSSSA
jgi:hypothetical protein